MDHAANVSEPCGALAFSSPTGPSALPDVRLAGRAREGRELIRGSIEALDGASG